MKTIMTFTYRTAAILGCLVALMLCGCVKNEFKVDFEFPKEHFGNYMMSYYAWDAKGGRWMEHTASIQEGRASADCITRFPTLIYISDASQPGKSIMIYAERGDRIKVVGKDKDMAAWVVTGNKLSERWSEWRKSSYSEKNDSKAFEKRIEEYVLKNPKDELSALLMLTEWNRRVNPEGFVRLWNTIGKEARSRQLIEMCGAADLLGVEFTIAADGDLEYAKDSKIKNIILRSRDNGTDSLRFDKASILYFYSENNAARREVVDSLKLLAKDYPDSMKRVMADIYMEADSATWVNSIRRDSLSGVVRAWQPRGIAEADMVSMGVFRLPWFIVKNKAAKEIYAGPDLKEAVAAFRKVAGKKDPKAAKNAKPKEPEIKSAPKPEVEKKSVKVPEKKPSGNFVNKSVRDPKITKQSNR